MTRTRYSYEGTPGTYDRGRLERARQDAMIAEAGGICEYMRGVKPRDKALTAAAGCAMMQEDEARDRGCDTAA